MTSDQWRKRPNNASSMVPCNGREQSRSQRKSSALSHPDSNMRSHVSLEWDGNQKRVIARRDQIGISWRDMRPYLASSPSTSNIVADVFSVPQEVYGFENLQDVLSYEVWESYLSESEKNHLLQFLPKGLEIEQVLQSLLGGDNFHFGNPLLNWSSRVCSGDFHPDAIREKDQKLNTEKKAYCAELHKYHNNMIGDLLKLKEKFERSKDLEGDVFQKTQKLETDMDRRISSSSNIPRVPLSEDNIAASSESYSSDADGMPCSSDNQNFSMVKGGDQNRVSKKGSLKDNIGNPSLVSAEVSRRVKPRKGDKRQQQNVSCNDGFKYMSYVKISKKQLEIVKSMKQSGKSILSRSLNRVLGTIESFNVQPYEVFIEEEQKNLRDHWIRLAKEALPSAYANWTGMKLQRRQLRGSLEQDLNERLTKLTTEDIKESDNHNTGLPDQVENEVDDHVCTPEGGDRSLSGSPHRDSELEFSSEKEFEPMNIDCEKQPEIAKLDDDANMNGAIVRTEFSESTDGGDAHLPCAGDVWPTTDITHSYYDDSTASPEYEIAPPKRQVVDLESDLQVVGDCEKDTSFRQSDDGSFGSYSNQGRDELFQMQSLFKGEEMLMYQEPKPTGLDFESTSNLLMGDGHFPGHAHFRDPPPHPMEVQEHKRDSRAYLQDHDFSDAGRFLMVPRQEWSVDPPPPPPPPPLSMNGGELGNWFCGDHQSRNGWSGGGGVRSGAVDQSLYGVLSYEPAPTEQHFMPSRSYGLPGGGPTFTNQSMSNAPALQPIPIPIPMPTPTPSLHHHHHQYHNNHHHPLDYMSAAREAEEMGWMGLPAPHHSDPMGKPYLRSWNPS